jgi:hypothetical protein
MLRNSVSSFPATSFDVSRLQLWRQPSVVRRWHVRDIIKMCPQCVTAARCGRDISLYRQQTRLDPETLLEPTTYMTTTVAKFNDSMFGRSRWASHRSLIHILFYAVSKSVCQTLSVCSHSRSIHEAPTRVCCRSSVYTSMLTPARAAQYRAKWGRSLTTNRAPAARLPPMRTTRDYVTTFERTFHTGIKWLLHARECVGDTVDFMHHNAAPVRLQRQIRSCCLHSTVHNTHASLTTIIHTEPLTTMRVCV